jgi:DnaJ-like protein
MACRSGASASIKGQVVRAWTNDNTPVGNPIDRDFGGAITNVMAGSLLVFLRRNIGVRILIRRRFVIACALLVGFSYIETPFDKPLTIFAITVVVLVFIHHARHMMKIKSGFPEWYSFDTGQSWIFAFVPLPKFLAQGIIEPLLCGALGWWLSQRSFATFYLGWWMTISAGLLFFLENQIRIARRESLFDLGDSIVASEHFARRAERFTQGAQGNTGFAAEQSHAYFWNDLLRGLRMAAAFAQGNRNSRKTDSHQQQQDSEHRRRNDAPSAKMTEAQALEILELKPGASEQEIRAAYNRLIQRVHPDLGGSNFFAKQLNAARDVLLSR